MHSDEPPQRRAGPAPLVGRERRAELHFPEGAAPAAPWRLDAGRVRYGRGLKSGSLSGRRLDPGRPEVKSPEPLVMVTARGPVCAGVRSSCRCGCKSPWYDRYRLTVCEGVRARGLPVTVSLWQMCDCDRVLLYLGTCRELCGCSVTETLWGL